MMTAKEHIPVLLVDGKCAVCTGLVKFIRKHLGKHKILFRLLYDGVVNRNVLDKKVDFAITLPHMALSNRIADEMIDHGIRCLGPTERASQRRNFKQCFTKTR